MTEAEPTSGDVALILLFALLDARLKRLKRRDGAQLLKDMTELLERWEHVTPVRAAVLTTASVKRADAVWRERLAQTMKAVR